MVVLCTAPTGSIPDGGDCDDSDASINPNGTEICDSVDNNCDGSADESTAVDATDWYQDLDADGYGDAGNISHACWQPMGYVPDNSDCDDSDSGAWPGADEYCDGVDNNCDGVVDEESALDAGAWYGDGDGDGGDIAGRRP